jgi:hypothetical protein
VRHVTSPSQGLSSNKREEPGNEVGLPRVSPRPHTEALGTRLGRGMISCDTGQQQGGRGDNFRLYSLKKGFKKIFPTMTIKKSHKNFSPSMSTKKGFQISVIPAFRGHLFGRLRQFAQCTAKMLWSFLPGAPVSGHPPRFQSATDSNVKADFTPVVCYPANNIIKGKYIHH